MGILDSAGLGDASSKIGSVVDTGLRLGKGFLIFLVVAGVIGLVTYLLAKRSSFTKKIHIFEEINGAPAPQSEDVAREIMLPNTSTKVFYLKKYKLYLPRPSRQTGKNNYWYFIRNDGEWINIGLENLNKTLTELKVNYDHTDMRYANASLKKLIEKSYKKTNWLKEYAPYIALGVTILLTGVSFYLILDKAGKVLSQIGGMAQSMESIATTVNSMLQSTENLCSSGGLRSV